MKTKFLKLKSLTEKYLLQNNTIKQRVFKNTFWLTLTEGSTKFLTILMTIWITRYFGVVNYGKFSFAFSYTALFGILVDFGFNTLVTREIAKNPKEASRYIFNIIASKLLLTILVYGLIFISIQQLHKPKDTELLVYIIGVFTIL